MKPDTKSNEKENVSRRTLSRKMNEFIEIRRNNQRFVKKKMWRYNPLTHNHPHTQQKHTYSHTHTHCHTQTHTHTHSHTHTHTQNAILRHFERTCCNPWYKTTLSCRLRPPKAGLMRSKNSRRIQLHPFQMTRILFKPLCVMMSKIPPNASHFANSLNIPCTEFDSFGSTSRCREWKSKLKKAN